MILTCCFVDGSADRKIAIGLVIKFPVLSTQVATADAVVVTVALLVTFSDFETTANGTSEEFVVAGGHFGGFTLIDVRLTVGFDLTLVKCTVGLLLTVVNVTVAGREESGGFVTVTCGILPVTDDEVVAMLTGYGVVRVVYGTVVGIFSGTEEIVFAVIKYGVDDFGAGTMVGIGLKKESPVLVVGDTCLIVFTSVD